jgi:protein-disulfide isomerase
MQYLKHLFTIVAVFGITMGTTVDGRADTSTAKTLGKLAIEKIVRNYLIANPEVVEEAIQALQAKREVAEKKRAQLAISEHRDALRGHPMTPVSGNETGDVTVVEFFDYLCGYCKRSLASMVHLLNTDKNVRVVWKELPILGPASRFAARAAMAAKEQDKYFDFHIGLMGAQGRLSQSKVMSIAANIGLDVDRLRKDMKNPKIEIYLDETKQLANTLGIRGTPAFIIGNTLIPGAIDEVSMRRIIEETRAGG